MSSKVFGNESPVDLTASDEPVYAFVFVGVQLVTDPSAKIYIAGSETDMTATNMPTGSASISGNNVIVTPVIKSLKGGSTYIVVVSGVADGIKTSKKLELRVQKDSSLN